MSDKCVRGLAIAIFTLAQIIILSAPFHPWSSYDTQQGTIEFGLWGFELCNTTMIPMTCTALTQPHASCSENAQAWYWIGFSTLVLFGLCHVLRCTCLCCQQRHCIPFHETRWLLAQFIVLLLPVRGTMYEWLHTCVIYFPEQAMEQDWFTTCHMASWIALGIIFTLWGISLILHMINLHDKNRENQPPTWSHIDLVNYHD